MSAITLLALLPAGRLQGAQARSHALLDATATPTSICPSPVDYASGLPEVQGTASGGTLWALLFYRPPAQVDQGEKIVWRMTGTGNFEIAAIGPQGQTIDPTWGPVAHIGSTWNRPGEEWGTVWTFPSAGCWRVHAEREGVSGDVWLAASSHAAPTATSTVLPSTQPSQTLPCPRGCRPTAMPVSPSGPARPSMSVTLYRRASSRWKRTTWVVRGRTDRVVAVFQSAAPGWERPRSYLWIRWMGRHALLGSHFRSGAYVVRDTPLRRQRSGSHVWRFSGAFRLTAPGPYSVRVAVSNGVKTLWKRAPVQVR